MALVERYDEVSKKVEQQKSALPKSVAAANFGVSLVGKTLSMNLSKAAIGSSVKILDLRGRVQMQKVAQSRNETMNLGTLKSGVYFVQVGTLSAQKIMLK